MILQYLASAIGGYLSASGRTSWLSAADSSVQESLVAYLVFSQMEPEGLRPPLSDLKTEN